MDIIKCVCSSSISRYGNFQCMDIWEYLKELAYVCFISIAHVSGKCQEVFQVVPTVV